MFLNLGFCCHWWNSQYGLRFDEGFYLNPDKKVAQQAFIDEETLKRFPWFKNLSPKKQDKAVSSANVTIDPFGDRFFPAMFGCDIAYSDANTPWAENHILTPDEIEAMPYMTMDEFRRDERVKVVTEQVNYVRGKYGWCASQQNPGSVINTAIYLRGMELFSDFSERPDTIHKLYGLITNRMMLAYDYFSQLDGKPSNTGVGNCSVCMISPKVYEAFNRKYDMMMMEMARSRGVLFGIHQDSDVTKYIDSYRAFDYLFAFDIGCDTDVRLFREAYRNITLNICLYTSFLRERTPDEIRRDVLKLAADGGDPEKTGFTCSDIDGSISDEKVTALYEAVYAGR